MLEVLLINSFVESPKLSDNSNGSIVKTEFLPLTSPDIVCPPAQSKGVVTAQKALNIHLFGVYERFFLHFE